MIEKPDHLAGVGDRPALARLLCEFVLGAGLLTLGTLMYVLEGTPILLAGLAAGALYDVAILHYAFTPPRRAREPRQFRLIAIFGYTAIAAVLLALSRWVAGSTSTMPGALGDAAWERAFVALVGLSMLGLVFAVPMAFFTRSVVWLATGVALRLRGRRNR